jgi:hypothetical protein
MTTDLKNNFGFKIHHIKILGQVKEHLCHQKNQTLSEAQYRSME